MAEKKGTSRAEKAVTDVKKKTSSTASSSKSKKKASGKKPPAPAKKAPKVKTEYENPISSSAVVAMISFFVFILFAVISVNADGALLKVLKAVVLGLVGQAGFYFSIPAALYMFIIHAFSGKKPVRLRSFCLVSFVLLCGMIYHLIVQDFDLADGFAIFRDLYAGGAAGTTGGILCGAAAVLLRWACGKTLSFFLCIFLAIITMLGAMQITIPSIIRAIANRPRDDWEEEEEDYIEPAAVVVNHIAQKQIEYKRQKREKADQAKQQTVQVPEVPVKQIPQKVQEPVAKPVQQNNVHTPVQEPAAADKVKQVPGKGAAFMDRIDVEINAPLAGTSGYVREDIPNVFEEPVEVPVKNYDGYAHSDTPSKMPELKLDTVPKEPVKKEDLIS